MGYFFKTEIAFSDNDFLCVDYSDAPSMWNFHSDIQNSLYSCQRHGRNGLTFIILKQHFMYKYAPNCFIDFRSLVIAYGT